ncbi:DUF4429 domain-containing protein [Nonomuraea zeae]|uniref:DUF4429 domain-containing protein n=1 Tax=Nonomuraea zeae TaxID=1642303 RepID=UPI0014784DDE|nr:DUF4429 domain-containing protein [Nonomuraea zeae]
MLTGRPDTELLAEYHADRLRLAADAARLGHGPCPPEKYALALVPTVPLRIRPSEGAAMFDGEMIRLEWSDDASARKTKKRLMEYTLADIRRVEWFPQGAMDEGYLRIVTWQEEADASSGGYTGRGCPQTMSSHRRRRNSSIASKPRPSPSAVVARLLTNRPHARQECLPAGTGTASTWRSKAAT